jgi:hypothetical protein
MNIITVFLGRSLLWWPTIFGVLDVVTMLMQPPNQTLHYKDKIDGHKNKPKSLQCLYLTPKGPKSQIGFFEQCSTFEGKKKNQFGVVEKKLCCPDCFLF